MPDIEARSVAPASHQLFIIYRARIRRSFDEMPSPIFLAQWRPHWRRAEKLKQPGNAMIHSSRRDRKTKVIAEALAMIAKAHHELEPFRPRIVHETDEWLWESTTEVCAALDRYAGRAMEIKKVKRRPPAAPAARPALCCINPTPAIYLSSRRDFVEVLTECQDQHRKRAEVGFVAAGALRNRTMGSA